MSEQVAKKDPTLKDVRNSLERIETLACDIVNGINLIHDILDKDVRAGEKVEAKEVATNKPTPLMNLRFDMNSIATTSASKLEEAVKGLNELRHKLV